jgi:hypothetical protein
MSRSGNWLASSGLLSTPGHRCIFYKESAATAVNRQVSDTSAEAWRFTNATVSLQVCFLFKLWRRWGPGGWCNPTLGLLRACITLTSFLHAMHTCPNAGQVHVHLKKTLKTREGEKLRPVYSQLVGLGRCKSASSFRMGHTLPLQPRPRIIFCHSQGLTFSPTASRAWTHIERP